jgi:integrase
LYDKRGQHRTLYSLRHSFATMIILDKGTNVHLLARHMGTSTAMIDKFYSHVQSKHKAEKLVITSGFQE